MIPRILVFGILLSSMGSNNCTAKPTTSTSHPSRADEETLNSLEDANTIYRQEYAKQMLSYMNLSVQPCDDFYEYACGNWKNTIKERQCEKQRQNLEDITYTVIEFIEEILQRADINDVAPEYGREFEMAKKFYNNCLETNLYSMRKSPEYLEILQKIGGFPALDTQWNALQFNWINMSAHLSNYGISSLIKEYLMSSAPFSPLFELPTFGFGIELHADTIANRSSTEYQLNRKQMFEILKVYEVPDNEIEGILENIFKFLTEVLNIAATFQENRRICQQLVLDEMKEADAEPIRHQWKPYFDIAWKGETVEIGLEWSKGPCIYFYRELNKIANHHKEAMANYLALKFIYHMNANLEDPKFHKDYCAFSLKKPMNFFFDHLYMKIHFNEEISQDVRKMSKDLQQSLRNVLQKTDWLDESTREAALLKESLVGLYIGRYEDPQVMNRLLGELKNLEFIDSTYEANRINLQKFATYMQRYYSLHKEDFSETTKPMELMLGITAQAFYYLDDNSMYLMAAVLQPPVYHHAWPSSLKYGTLGYSLGHEFTHGFDTFGSNFDHTGAYRNWWSKESATAFKKRANCFVDFYNNYTVPEINRNIRGEFTKDENIADAGALHLALMAYRRYAQEEAKKFESLSEFVKSEQMPGLEASPEQLIFLGAAQIWCSSFKKVDYWKALIDGHTIDKYRVLGMMSNSHDFAKVYNCPLGSKMHSSNDKCQIW